MKTPAVTALEFFRRNAAFLTILAVFGLALGLLAGLLTVSLEKPVYQGRVLCRPIRPASDRSDIPHDVWLATEAVALGSPENLAHAVRELNLERELRMSLGEAAQYIRKHLEISVVPGSALVEVTVRTNSNKEAANIATGVINARRNEAENLRRRGSDSAVQRQFLPGRIAFSKNSCEEKRITLLAVMQKHGIPAAAATGPLTDADLIAQALHPDLASACDAWRGEAIQLEAFQAQLAAANAALELVPQYAEILEEAYPSVNPISTDPMGHIYRFTLTGTAIGLGIALLVAVMFRRGPASGAPVPPLSQIPLAVGDY